MNISRLSILLITLVSFSSCKNFSLNEKPDIVARVNDKTLFKNQLTGIVPEGIQGEDSIALIKKWVDNWILEQLLLQKAEENLKDELKDFEKQLSEYRKSLLIFTYENEIIKNLTDTTISDTQIRSYYDKNRDNFLLNDNIIRANYIITNSKGNDVSKLKRWMLSNNNNPQLAEFCSNQAYKCFFEDSVWIKVSDLRKDIPIDNQNEDQILNKGKFIEIKDSALLYLIYVKDVKQKRDLAPVEEVKGTIKSILLNKRKLEFIEQMRKDVYNEALQKEEFEVFIK